MSITITCDWCGMPIDGPQVDLKTDNHFDRDGEWSSGPFGHFHNTDECFSPVGDAIKSLIEARRGLEAIPVLDHEPEIPLSPGGQLGEVRADELGSPADGSLTHKGKAESEAWRVARDREIQIAKSPGGIYELRVTQGIKHALSRAKILTVAEFEVRYWEGTIGGGYVPGIGPMAMRAIERMMRQRMSPAEREFRELLDSVGYRSRHALAREGVRTLDHAAALSDAQLLAIDGVGVTTVKALREAADARVGERSGV